MNSYNQDKIFLKATSPQYTAYELSFKITMIKSYFLQRKIILSTYQA